MSKVHTVEQVRDFFDWKPVAIPDTYEWDGEVRETGQTKWVRSDNGFWLGTRGDSTPPNYAQTLLGNMELLTDSELTILNYGQLSGGRQAYVQIATEQKYETAGVFYRPMITATSSMDGSFANGYGRGVQVIICLNTYQMARSESKSIGKYYQYKNTKNAKFEVMAARTALDIMFDDSDDFAALLKADTAEKVSEKRFAAFVDKWEPLAGKTGRAATLAEHKRDEINDLWTSDPRVAPWRGTKFGVIQAVNTYEHHYANVRGADRADRNMLKTMKGEWVNVNAEAEKLLASV